MNNAKCTGTDKDQSFPPGTPPAGQWWYQLLDGPDQRGQAANDLTTPVIFSNLQPGTYRVSLVRLAANGVDDVGAEVFSTPFPVDADVVLKVAAGISVVLVQGE